jgi:hypothetical protein
MCSTPDYAEILFLVEILVTLAVFVYYPDRQSDFRVRPTRIGLLVSGQVRVLNPSVRVDPQKFPAPARTAATNAEGVRLRLERVSVRFALTGSA